MISTWTCVAEEPIIEMGEGSLFLRDAEIVEVPVTRKGNLEDATYVAWKTIDGEAVNGLHYIGGEGEMLVFS